MMRKKILIVVLVLVLLFIWGNSCLPVRQSSLESRWVLRLLRPFLEPLFGEGNVTHHLIRKLAHFTEFTVLGAVIHLLVQSGKERSVTRLLFTLTMGLLAAFADESIQMLSDRGDQIIDVWLDFSGVFTGVVLSGLLLALRRLRRRRSNEHSQRE